MSSELFWPPCLFENKASTQKNNEEIEKDNSDDIEWKIYEICKQVSSTSSLR